MTFRQKTTQYAPATIGQRPAALSRLLNDLPLEDCDSKVLSLLDAIATGQMDARGLWLAEREGELVDALWWLPQPDGVALVWLAPETLTASSAAVRGELLTAACQQMDAEHVAVSQILTEPSDPWSPPLLQAAAYHQTVTLQFWARSLTDLSEPSPPPESHLESVGFEFGDREQQFVNVLAATYQESLDCPEFTPMRTAQQALDCHRQCGTFEPELWRLFLYQELPIGLVLVADHPDQDAVELMYFGITPAARGQGYGEQMLQWALREGKSRERETLFLAADTRNHYAQRLYKKTGFFGLSQRQVWWRFASPSKWKSLTQYAHELGTSGNLGSR